jgi:hypothetical protein
VKADSVSIMHSFYKLFVDIVCKCWCYDKHCSSLAQKMEMYSVILTVLFVKLLPSEDKISAIILRLDSFIILSHYKDKK